MAGETFWFVEVWKIYCTIKGIIFLILGRISFSAIQPPAGNRTDIYYLDLKKVNRVLSKVGVIRKWARQVGTGTPTIKIKRTQLEPWKVKTPKSRKCLNCYTPILGQKVWFGINNTKSFSCSWQDESHIDFYLASTMVGSGKSDRSPWWNANNTMLICTQKEWILRRTFNNA